MQLDPVQPAVGEHDDDQAEPEPGRDRQLRRGHREPAVPGQADDRRARHRGQRGTDRGRQPEAHRGQPVGDQRLPGRERRPRLPRHDLVRPDVRRHHRARRARPRARSRPARTGSAGRACTPRGRRRAARRGAPRPPPPTSGDRRPSWRGTTRARSPRCRRPRWPPGRPGRCSAPCPRAARARQPPRRDQLHRVEAGRHDQVRRREQLPDHLVPGHVERRPRTTGCPRRARPWPSRRPRPAARRARQARASAARRPAAHRPRPGQQHRPPRRAQRAQRLVAEELKARARPRSAAELSRRRRYPAPLFPNESMVTVRCTAPGRSAVAVRRARRSTVSADAGSSRAVSLVTGANSRLWSISWCVQNCSRELSTWPDTASSGHPVQAARDATPLSSAVDPGPSVDRQAPTVPVRIAAPSAMNAADASRTAAMIAGPPARAASMKSTSGLPRVPEHLRHPRLAQVVGQRSRNRTFGIHRSFLLFHADRALISAEVTINRCLVRSWRTGRDRGGSS